MRLYKKLRREFFIIPHRLRICYTPFLVIVSLFFTILIVQASQSTDNVVEQSGGGSMVEIASTPPQETVIIYELEKTQEEEIDEITYTSTQMYASCNVNLRTEPNTASESIVVISQDEVVTAQIPVENNSDWYFVEYGENSGYVKSEYLKIYDPNLHLMELGLEYEYQDWVRELIVLFDFDIDEYFIYGMMYTENRFKQEPESAAGAQGILQIIPSTWKFLYSDFCEKYPEYAGEIVNDPLDKKSNITLGMYYLKVISDEFGCTISNNPHAILTSYNRGSSNAQGYYKNHGTYATPYSEEILRAAEYIREHKSWKEGL